MPSQNTRCTRRIRIEIFQATTNELKELTSKRVPSSRDNELVIFRPKTYNSRVPLFYTNSGTESGKSSMLQGQEEWRFVPNMEDITRRRHCILYSTVTYVAGFHWCHYSGHVVDCIFRIINFRMPKILRVSKILLR
jgi:hypothetical protein